MRERHCSRIRERKHHMQFRADFHELNRIDSIDYNFAFGRLSCEQFSFVANLRFMIIF